MQLGRATCAAAALVLCAAARPDVAAQLPGALAVDVLVYAANPAGLGAGIAAAGGVARRHSVLVMEPLRMIGGMAAAGGVGLMNAEQDVYRQGLGGVFCALNGAHYGNASRPNCFAEPHVCEASFWTMVNATANMSVALGCVLTGASAPDAFRLASATFDCSAGGGGAQVVVTAAVFIDASYDGDLMVASGAADFTSGREAASVYGESLGGTINPGEPNESFGGLPWIDPHDDAGALLPGVSADAMPANGTGDDRLMAFSYFLCAATLESGRALAWARPPGYNPADFELLRRVIEAYVAMGRTFFLEDFSEYQAYTTFPNVTKLLLCCGRAPVNMDQPDLNRLALPGGGHVSWAAASVAQRATMAAAHKYYLLGSLYFMANDPRVNNDTRAAIGRWGACADEYTAFDHVPVQLYVRISNRLVGDVVLTQTNLRHPSPSRIDSVAVGNWDYDQHIESRRAVPDPRNASRLTLVNEGYFRAPLSWPNASSGGNYYDVPFAAMLPKRGQAPNLLVPVALSASSVAYSSTRIEQMFMDLGTAAGVAAALALEAVGPAAAAGCSGGGGGAAPCAAAGLPPPLQDTNVTAVQEVLVSRYQQRIHGPPP